MGVEPVPNRWTIEREVARAGLARPRARVAGYVPKGVPYPNGPAPEPGQVHQADMIGPRHLHGGAQFYVLNVLDVGSHEASSEIFTSPRPDLVSAGLLRAWAHVGVPAVAQFDNGTAFRGAIPPAYAYFGPVVAACLDLGVTPRFIPLREPWRNGVVEHFNDVWDKSFFRTETFTGLEHLTVENATFVGFHNSEHRYSAHRGASPKEIWQGRVRGPPPHRLPASRPAPHQGTHRGGPLRALFGPGRLVGTVYHLGRAVPPPVRHGGDPCPSPPSRRRHPRR